MKHINHAKQEISPVKFLATIIPGMSTATTLTSGYNCISAVKFMRNFIKVTNELETAYNIFMAIAAQASASANA